VDERTAARDQKVRQRRGIAAIARAGTWDEAWDETGDPTESVQSR
jgi:hypothetical protein